MMEFKNIIFKNNVRSVSVSMCTPTDINTTRLRNFKNVPGFTIFFYLNNNCFQNKEKLLLV
jgi:hypothetical protein